MVNDGAKGKTVFKCNSDPNIMLGFIEIVLSYSGHHTELIPKFQIIIAMPNNII